MSFRLRLISLWIFGIFSWISCNRNALPDLSKFSNDDKGNQEKLKLINQCIEGNSKNPDLFFLKAKVHKDLNNYDQSIKDINQAIDLDSLNPKYFDFAGQLFESIPFIKGAIGAYEKKSKLMPKDTSLYIKLGQLYFYIQEYKLSQEVLNKAIALDQLNYEPYYLRGLIFKEVKKIPEAIRSLSIAAEQNPNDFNTQMQLGLIFGNKKDIKSASYYSNALKIKPNNEQALYSRGYFYQSIDSFRLAIADYQAILDQDKDNKNALYNLGYIAYLQKEYKKGIEYFTKAIQSESTYAEAYYSRAMCEDALGNKTKAKSDLLKSQELDPLYGGFEFKKK